MQFETDFHAGARSTVFVVETEQVVRSALHYILRDRYQTHAFAALEDALAGDTPDAVLLGVGLLQDGSEALLARLGERFAGAKVLIVAERNSDPLAQACLEHGAHGIIGKPISFDMVCDAVDTALTAPILPAEPSRLIRVAFG